MLGATIHEYLKSPDFHPFTIVLTTGEHLTVRDPRAAGLASIEVRGQRVYASAMLFLEIKGDMVVDHVISLSTIAKVVKESAHNEHR